MRIRIILSRLAMSPTVFGLVAGCLAVVVQLAFMPGQNAYGICTICHARDMLAYIGARILGPAAGGTVGHLAWPAFTTAGLILGSFCAARLNGEFRPVGTGRGKRMFALGVLVAVAGLAVMSCPTRLFLRFAYADPYSPLALSGLFLGIACAVAIIRKG